MDYEIEFSTNLYTPIVDPCTLDLVRYEPYARRVLCLWLTLYDFRTATIPKGQKQRKQDNHENTMKVGAFLTIVWWATGCNDGLNVLWFWKIKCNLFSGIWYVKYPNEIFTPKSFFEQETVENCSKLNLEFWNYFSHFWLLNDLPFMLYLQFGLNECVGETSFLHYQYRRSTLNHIWKLSVVFSHYKSILLWIRISNLNISHLQSNVVYHSNFCTWQLTWCARICNCFVIAWRGLVWNLCTLAFNIKFKCIYNTSKNKLLSILTDCRHSYTLEFHERPMHLPLGMAIWFQCQSKSVFECVSLEIMKLKRSFSYAWFLVKNRNEKLNAYACWYFLLMVPFLCEDETIVLQTSYH